MDRASDKDTISVLEDVLGGTIPTTASGVLLVRGGIIGVSPRRLCRGVSDDFLLVTDDADMEEGITVNEGRTTGAIPNSFHALSLTAAVGFAMASLCRLTNSAIDTIFSFGFTSTGGLGVG
jgi:hypothetical protein